MQDLVPELGFGFLARLDVTPDAIQHLLAIELDGGQGDFNPEVPAGRVAMHPFEPVARSLHGRLDHPVGLVLGGFAIRLQRGGEVSRMAAQQAGLVRVTQDGDRRLVAIDEAIVAHDPDRVGGLVEHGAEAQFAGPQRFGLPARPVAPVGGSVE